MKAEHAHYFSPFKIGDLTDKGKIDDLFFLRFGDGACAFKWHDPEGKGLLMASIGSKNYAIGELKLLTSKSV